MDRSNTRNIEMENTGPIPNIEQDAAEFDYKDEENGAGRKKKIRIKKVKKSQPVDDASSQLQKYKHINEF